MATIFGVAAIAGLPGDRTRAWAQEGGTTVNKQETDERPAGSKSDAASVPSHVNRDLVRHDATLTRLRKAVERLRDSDALLEQQHHELELLIDQVRATRGELAAPLASVDQQILELGPKPEEGKPEEPPVLRDERNRLDVRRAGIVAAQKRADLLVVRAEQLIRQIQVYRLENFTNDILKRSDSPASLKLWRAVASAMPRLVTQLATVSDNWWAAASAHVQMLPIVLGLAVLIYVALFFLRTNIISRVLVEPTDPRPGFLRRVATTTWLVPIIALPGAATALFMFIAGDVLDIWSGTIRAFVHTGLIAFLLFCLVTALTTGVLQPRRPSWRLIGVPTPVARRLLWTTNLIAGVYATDLFLHQSIRLFHMPVPIRVLETSLANLAFAILLIVFALTALPDGMRRISGRLLKSAFNWLRVPIVLAAAFIISVTVLGYVSLGRFIAGQVMLMGAGGAAVLLVHLAIRAATAQADSLVQPVERLVDEKEFLSAQRRRQFADVINFLLNMLLAAVALVLLLLSWGIPQSQLLDGLKALFFGFEIGQFRISLFRILIGVGLFVFVLLATRLMQRWLERSVLASPKVDVGIANSLLTGVGYLGVGVAVLIGLSYAGIDFTQLTLVIGALSLGVGLGLQSIVNNFVSGLILLVERPVKVGDWVVIGDDQGYVRKISVRATEIETFDRASVIIPNSELISGVVQNWTHRNAMGRVIVNVGVAYDSDPDQVTELLRQIAKDSDLVLGFPEPFVAFEEFGASSLDFSLRCYVPDVNTSLSTKSALRTEILKRFREHGIEIPFPQHDVHMRDLDGVRGYIARAIAERDRERAGDNATVDGMVEATSAPDDQGPSRGGAS